MVAFANRRSRWHRRQNKFGKLWELSKVSLRLVITYFNWIWVHSRLGTTAAQRADLTAEPWTQARYCCLFHAFLMHDRLK